MCVCVCVYVRACVCVSVRACEYICELALPFHLILSILSLSFLRPLFVCSNGVRP